MKFDLDECRDCRTGPILKYVEGHSRGIACLHADGNRMATGSSDKSIKIWDIETGQCIMTLNGHADLVRTVQIEQNLAVSGSYDESVRIW